MIWSLQYDVCTGAPYHKLDMLQSLANNCELQPFEADSRLRHKAAEYRRALFVEMANQGHPVPKRCVACRENCKAHKPSASKDAPKTKVIVLGCLDLIHKSCAQKLGGEAPCPECKHEIGEWN